jgi:hypothetical protein
MSSSPSPPWIVSWKAPPYRSSRPYVSLDEVAPVGTVYLLIVILTVEQIVGAPIGVERVLPTAQVARATSQ